MCSGLTITRGALIVLFCRLLVTDCWQRSVYLFAHYDAGRFDRFWASLLTFCHLFDKFWQQSGSARCDLRRTDQFGASLCPFCHLSHTVCYRSLGLYLLGVTWEESTNSGLSSYLFAISLTQIDDNSLGLYLLSLMWKESTDSWLSCRTDYHQEMYHGDCPLSSHANRLQLYDLSA